MATTVIEENGTPTLERVPVRYRLLALVAVIAAAASFAAQPFAAIAVVGCAVIAGEIGRRVR